MPKITIHSEKEFENWLSKMVLVKKYSLYLVLSRNLIVAVPLVSTAPIMLGVFETMCDLPTLEQKLDVLGVKFKIPTFVVTDFEFSDSKKV